MIKGLYTRCTGAALLTSTLASCGVIVVGVWMAGCGTAPSGQPAGHIPPKIIPSYTIVDVPLPANLKRDQLSPRSGTKLATARLPLDQILKTLDRPDYLPPTEQQTLAADPEQPAPAPSSPSEPSLRAQHAYVQGLSAWLDRDVAQAKRELKAARRLLPESTDLMRLLGSIYMRTLEPARGAKLLASAVKGNPEDVDSLYLLGRYSGNHRKWDQAITTLAYALSLPKADADPALPTIITYLLGNALAQQGYDQAAIDHLTRFVNQRERFGRTTKMIRELIVLSRERDSIWQTIGDCQHRLGRPIEAVNAYEQALKQGRVVRKSLIWRLLYSFLRVGLPRSAERVLLADLARQRADKESLQMVRYLTEQGADRAVLAQTLRKHYDLGNDTSAVLLALVELLDRPDALRLLEAHMDQHPTDLPALRLMIRLRMSGDHGTVEAIRTTASAIRRAPNLARNAARLLLQAIDDPRVMIDTFQLMTQQERNDPVVCYLAAAAHIKAHQADQAIDQLRSAVAGPAELQAARIALASLLTDKGEFDAAQKVLEPLEDSGILEVIRTRVRIMVQTGRADEALSLLDQALFQQPNNLDLIIQKAKVHLVAGRAPQAERTLLDALDQQPRSELLYEQLIHLYQSGLISQSAVQYQQLVRRMMRMIPTARVARLERAKVLTAGGRYEQAEPLLRRLLSEKPQDNQTLDLLLQALVKTERENEAAELLDKAIGQDRGENQALLAVAMQHYRRTNNREQTMRTAVRLVTLMIDQRPLPVRTINSLMHLLTTLEAGDQATDLLEAQLEIHPDDRGLLLLARQHFERIEDRERSFDVTERLLELSPASMVRQIKLGVFYLQYDRPQQALDALGLALEQSEQDAGSVVGLISEALFRSGTPERADRWFADAIEKYPRHARRLRFGWAMHCDRRGDHDQAEQLVLALSNDHPDDAEAGNWLGYTWADSGRHLDRAQQLIQRALESDPDNAAYLDSMGWVLYKFGQFQEAAEYLERAQARNGGDHPVIVDHFGDALYRIGQTERALKTWRRANDWLESKIAEKPNPELVGLAKRLTAKITAAGSDLQPPLADAPGTPNPPGALIQEHPQDNDTIGAIPDKPATPNPELNGEPMSSTPADDPIDTELPTDPREPVPNQ